jgi:hypothetical protein
MAESAFGSTWSENSRKNNSVGQTAIIHIRDDLRYALEAFNREQTAAPGIDSIFALAKK